MLNKMLSNMGYIGSYASFFIKPFATWTDTGTNTGAISVTSILKSGNSTLKSLYEWNKSNKQLDKLQRMLPERAKEVRLKRLFGLNNKYTGTPSKASSWKMRFKSNVNRGDGLFEQYTSGGSKAAFAWAGLAINFASNAISNYDEYKSGEITSKRAAEETFVETAVDVAKDWAIGAAVVAGLTATVGFAPVLAVGALTVAANIGLD